MAMLCNRIWGKTRFERVRNRGDDQRPDERGGRDGEGAWLSRPAGQVKGAEEGFHSLADVLVKMGCVGRRPHPLAFTNKQWVGEYRTQFVKRLADRRWCNVQHFSGIYDALVDIHRFKNGQQVQIHIA